MNSAPAPPLAETERLILRQVEPYWAADLEAYFERNRAHFKPYSVRQPDSFYSLEAWRERASELDRATNERRGLHLLLFERQVEKLVGNVNFTGVMGRPFHAAYLGYQLDEAAVGKGLMHEALRTAIPFAMAHLKLHRIMANYVPVNERSGRLLKRLGFQVEGYARDYLLLDEVWKDHILTSFVDTGWKASE